MSTIFQRRRGGGGGGGSGGLAGEEREDRGLEEGRARRKHHGNEDDDKDNGNGNDSDDDNDEKELASAEESSKQRRRRCRRSRFPNGIAIAIAIAGVGFLLFFLAFRRVLRAFRRSPKLPVPNVDVPVPDAGEWPLVHIVQSRFMQEQGPGEPPETLGMARFKLFETFCLPSMVRQSSRNFFWIIKTDPKFTATGVFEELVRSVRSHDNIYVVASNKNYLFGSGGREGSWRDGREAVDLLESRIYTGNITRLHQAMALRNERPVLETRLDADDGLHEYYIEYIQRVALERFRPPSGNGNGNRDTAVPRWLYWCSRRHIEWHSDTDASLSDAQKRAIGGPEVGYMNAVQHDKLCVTPGITIGYNTIVHDRDGSGSTADVPQYDHDKLYKKVRNSMACYDDDNNHENNERTKSEKPHDAPQRSEMETENRGPCLELVEAFLFCAIRSRTLTSAGMQKVRLAPENVLPGDAESRERLAETLRRFAEERFGVTSERLRETQGFLSKHEKGIARENLLGQCAPGHSCKDAAREELLRIARPESESSDGSNSNSNKQR